jgi:hypothetical protein
MLAKSPPLLALGLVIAQMFVVGVHSLEHTDIEHDCDHHDMTLEVVADVAPESHFDCTLCSLAKVGGDYCFEASFFAEIVPACSSSDQFGATLLSRRFELSNRLRGPPALS